MKRILPTIGGLAGVVVVTVVGRMLGITNPTTAALCYLLIVLFTASATHLRSAIITSLAATLALNYFFLPPIGRFTIADTHNWIALVVFLVVSIVASQLSTSVQHRAREAEDRRGELTRLFDVTRDILLTTEGERAVATTASHVARRFELSTVTICLPSPQGGWSLHHGGTDQLIQPADLDRALAGARGALEFDATTRSYGGRRSVRTESGGVIELMPIRLGMVVIGLLAVGGRDLEPGTLDAIAGVVAIALERSQFLEERRAAELTAQRADLSSALLASLSHDLRTPLTAVRVALSNVLNPAVPDGQRAEQGELARRELERLNRLFQEILDMARIEARAVRAERQWATAADVIEAAVAHAGDVLTRRAVHIDADSETLVEMDPRLTSAALAHLLENAAQYSPVDAPIEIRGWVDGEGLRLTVSDHGPGLDPGELARLFEPFFRGTMARQHGPGTGMGLPITRGLLFAQGGRVWAENIAPRGARFSIAVPGPARRISKEMENA